MSNETMHLSLRMWMRLPLLPVLGATTGLPCSCKSSTVLEETHILNCNVDAARDIRHNVMAYCLQDMLQSTQQNAVILEPRAASTGSELHRFDLSVAGFDSTATNLKLDVTIRNPIAAHIVDRAASSRLAAATDAVNAKLAKYKKFLTSQDTPSVACTATCSSSYQLVPGAFTTCRPTLAALLRQRSPHIGFNAYHVHCGRKTAAWPQRSSSRPSSSRAQRHMSW